MNSDEYVSLKNALALTGDIDKDIIILEEEIDIMSGYANALNDEVSLQYDLMYHEHDITAAIKMNRNIAEVSEVNDMVAEASMLLRTLEEEKRTQLKELVRHLLKDDIYACYTIVAAYI